MVFPLVNTVSPVFSPLIVKQQITRPQTKYICIQNNLQAVSITEQNIIVYQKYLKVLFGNYVSIRSNVIVVKKHYLFLRRKKFPRFFFIQLCVKEGERLRGSDRIGYIDKSFFPINFLNVTICYAFPRPRMHARSSNLYV